MFESLEERLNLSLMFVEVEPNSDTVPGSFPVDLAMAQVVTHPGPIGGIVDSATMTSATDNNPDYYTFTAAASGAINVAVVNEGGDPDGDGDPAGTRDNLDVRVFRASPTDIDDTIGLQNVLGNGEQYVESFTASEGERFYVRVAGDAGGDDANYRLRIWNSDIRDSFGNHNNSINNAADLGIVGGLGDSGTIT